MLYYDRVEVSKGIGINKTSALKGCDICHYLYFLDKGFNHNLSAIAFLNINYVDYRCIITRINKSEAINLLQKVDLNENSETL